MSVKIKKPGVFLLAICLVICVIVVVLLNGAKKDDKDGEGSIVGTKLEPVNRFNVVIIGIDTLRFDHTSLGVETVNGRSLTPHLEKFATKGTVFSSAVSQAPWTLPAFASIITGRYPHEHGANSLAGILVDEELTLAEIFKQAGYFTGAVVSHGFLGLRHGLGQGYDYLNEDCVLGKDAITSADITDKTIEVLENKKDENFFLFVHYFDPHYNYMDHSDWDFADAYLGWLSEKPRDIKEIRRKSGELKGNDIQYLVDLYDEEVAYTDKQIGRLLNYFEENGLCRNTLFVVVGDHGEEFMERGWVGHTISLYEELIRVPMFVVLPGPRPQRPLDEDVVETRAIFTTVLDCLGLDGLFENIPESFVDRLSPSADTQRSKDDGRAFSTVWLPDEKGPKHVQLCAVRTGRWKLIRDYLNDKSFLYDLSKDPAETENLFSVETETADKMSKELDDWHKQMMSGRSKGPEIQLTEEEIKRLKSLGYL